MLDTGLKLLKEITSHTYQAYIVGGFVRDYLLGIENEEFDHARIRRIIARNASQMTQQEKKDLIDALFGED